MFQTAPWVEPLTSGSLRVSTTFETALKLDKNFTTVDGWNPAFTRRSPVEVGSLSHYLRGFIHPRWCRISSINSMWLNICCRPFAFGTNHGSDLILPKSMTPIVDFFWFGVILWIAFALQLSSIGLQWTNRIRLNCYTPRKTNIETFKTGAFGWFKPFLWTMNF